MKFISTMLLVAGVMTTSLITAPAQAQTDLNLHVIASSDQAQPTSFSLEDLDGLEQLNFTTSTIWTDGPQEFSGVSLKTLLTHIKAKGSSVDLIAMNDYSVSVDIADLEDDAPLIATRMNGETMSVRDKGPFWMVYPYDRDAKYNTELHYSLSIWQLNRMTVVD